ncbi:MAG: methyl-accepting chemotaxis protein [Candidatus Nitrosocaldaceae archaeon]|nr:MAG: methyl-accepting chemotaxis protein [Candidatus Nitrosocaldaceae archaeon]
MMFNDKRLNSNAFKWSLNKKIVISLLVCSILPLIFLAYTSINYIERELSERISAQFNNEAYNRGSIIENILSLRMEQLDIISTLLNDNTISINDKREHIINVINDLATKGTTVESFVVTDANGRIIISNEGLEGSLLNDKIDNNIVNFENYNGKTVLTIAKPLYVDNAFNGIVIIRFLPDTINSILLNRDGLGETGEIYLVNNNKLMVSESRFIENAAFRTVVDTLPVKECIEKGNVIKSQVYPDYRGIPIFGTSYCMDKYGLVLLAEIDEAEIIAPIKALREQIIYSVIGIAVGIFIFAIFMSRSISRPILKISEYASRLGRGDLTAKIRGIKSKDEIGELTINTNNTIDNLRSLISNIRDSAEKLAKNIHNLSSTCNQFNSTIQQLSLSIQHVSQGSQDQASKINTANELLSTITSNMKKVDNKMQEAAKYANKMGYISKEGSRNTTEAIESMQSMIYASNESVTKMKNLLDKTSKITAVLDVIQKIAEETNMLALNAAIEAARAGEVGRGFAVVAEEVRNLAQGSAKASEEISNLINDIQKDAIDTTQAIENNANQVLEGKQVIDTALETLDNIVREAEKIAYTVKDASNTIKEQIKHIEEVSDNMNEVATVAENNAASSEEAAAAMEEQSSAMEELANMMKDLVNLSNELKDSIRMFRLPDDIKLERNNSINDMNGEAIKEEVEHEFARR